MLNKTGRVSAGYAKDLKTGAGGKAGYWRDLETRLIDQGWYRGSNISQKLSLFKSPKNAIPHELIQSHAK
jgi:hypothetical protein